MAHARNHAEDLRGASRLTLAAIAGIVDIVEAMHGTISGIQRFRSPRADRTGGITGLVYGGIRGMVGVVDGSLDALLRGLRPLLGESSEWPGREAFLSALNGVLGDYLAATRNPLAIPMSLRVDGPARDKVVVFIHGLCMGDAQWGRHGQDYGAALARHGYTPVYVRYNTGCPIAANGRRLDREIEAMLATWPVPVARIALIGHSMGGLVARSAADQADRAGHAWRKRLADIVFLGTPHRGAPLERGGRWVDLLFGASAYTAPLARIGRIRSAGITDLRHGLGLPPPAGVALHAVAATVGKSPGKAVDFVGDGLVPLASALGHDDDPRRDLGIAPERQLVIRGAGHLDLLGHPAVSQRLVRWLAPAPPATAQR